MSLLFFLLIGTTALADETAVAPATVDPATPMPAQAPAAEVVKLCPSRCIVLMGDSRTVCLEECFYYNEDFHRVYFYTEAPKRGVYDAVYVNYEQDLALLFVGECRGYLGNGSFDYAVKRTKNYTKNNAFVNACDQYTYCNLYSFNDVILSNWRKKNSAAKYMAKDTKLATTLKNPYAFIQFNAGPVSENGNSFINGKNNDLISEFNLGFVPNDKVLVWDLYGYLMKEGYDCIVDEEDPEGIHYDAVTSYKILDKVMEFAPPKAELSKN